MTGSFPGMNHLSPEMDAGFWQRSIYG
jgi:hypothetical protein